MSTPRTESRWEEEKWMELLDVQGQGSKKDLVEGTEKE